MLSSSLSHLGTDRGPIRPPAPLYSDAVAIEEHEAHTLTLTVLMTPETANFAGNVHGGHLLKVLDQVAYSCASRFTRHYCVTAAVDRVVFRQPVHVGELVTSLASVNHTGRSSLEVGIRVEAEDIVSGVRIVRPSAKKRPSSWESYRCCWCMLRMIMMGGSAEVSPRHAPTAMVSAPMMMIARFTTRCPR